MDFFFYGTLLDPDIRNLVLGADAAAHVVEPARLMGYRRLAQGRSTVPVLVPRPGAATDGVLVRGLGSERTARLVYYEGPGYRRVLSRVRGAGGREVRAWVFIAPRPGRMGHRSWRLMDWQRRHKRAYLRQATRWMAALAPSA
jgi:hypothetical protein